MKLSKYTVNMNVSWFLEIDYIVVQKPHEVSDLFVFLLKIKKNKLPKISNFFLKIWQSLRYIRPDFFCFPYDCKLVFFFLLYFKKTVSIKRDSFPGLASCYQAFLLGIKSAQHYLWLQVSVHNHPAFMLLKKGSRQIPLKC